MNQKDILLLEVLNKNISNKDTEIGEAIEIIIRLFESINIEKEKIFNITPIPFDAGKFTGTAPMTWTITNLGHYTYYMIKEDLMLLQWGILNSTLGGTASNAVNIKLPKNYSVARINSGGSYSAQGNGYYFNNGIYDIHLVSALAGNNFISLFKRDASNYTLVGGLQSYGAIILKVNQ